ncbi:GtrA family protein [Clostridioides difficile]|nr:GtrA family protein [Clostridioides difficile]EJX3386615.1 GtrA family protein [Clostridioides difficile]
MLFKKYEETILYLFFGALTTIINIITYLLLTRIIFLDFLSANALAWFCAILFAYITNKFFVFKSRKLEVIFFIKEFASFFSLRLLSGIIEMIIMYVTIDLLSINDFLVKILTNIIVIILNFIFSKMIVFR